MLRTIPGVQYQADQDSVGGSYGTGTPNIGGAASGTNILAVDGVVSNDMGTPNVFSSVTTLDAIGEVKIVLNSYQAEYAGNGGAVVQVVTKSGRQGLPWRRIHLHPQRSAERQRLFQQPEQRHKGTSAVSLSDAGRNDRRTQSTFPAIGIGPEQVVRLL